MFIEVVADILLNFLLFLPVSFYVVLLFSKDILLNALENILKEKVFFCFWLGYFLVNFDRFW